MGTVVVDALSFTYTFSASADRVARDGSLWRDYYFHGDAWRTSEAITRDALNVVDAWNNARETVCAVTTDYGTLTGAVREFTPKLDSANTTAPFQLLVTARVGGAPEGRADIGSTFLSHDF